MAHVYARPHHMLQTEEEVLDIVEDDPSTSTREIARQVKMSNPIKALNEHFNYNVKLAKALQQLLTPNDIRLIAKFLERKMIGLWIDKLLDMDKTMEQMVIRSDYMWFILARKSREPFSKLPPAELVPLKKFVELKFIEKFESETLFFYAEISAPRAFPLHVYEYVLIMNEPNMVYIDNRNNCTNKIPEKENSATATSCSSVAKR
ncbi:hypothetical protein NQ317_019400 [Molorchus minor]|uniref:DUF4485 domain-containing protein n=1 Tax=Molorchus minor TaxID=1323400 RepID=A0ABQ9JIK6_9CUCU|nr:hypothetical protein NQ317_019400 [Molorchus minor]